MATPFSTIYERALFLFKGYDILKLDYDDAIENVLHNYLLMAQGDFQNICRKDLSDRDDDNQCYGADLDDVEIGILAMGIRWHYVSYLSANDELFKNVLSTKDATFYSPANIQREITTMKEFLYTEYRHKMLEYSYYAGNISTLRA